MPEYPLLDLARQRPASGHYVYRFHDTAGDPLYIGSTNNFWMRVSSHMLDKSKDWWPEVSWERTIIEIVCADPCLHGRRCELPGHAEMLRHEADLIKSLRPRYNLNLTGYCRRGLHLLSEHGKVRTSGIGCYTCQLEQMRIKHQAGKLQVIVDSGQQTFADLEET